MDGILAIDKPLGITSHDVVARVRRLAGQRRVGHAGTLDPLASGVLLLCLGEATRLSDLLMDGDKWYLARVALGAGTSTDDAEGGVVRRAEPAFDHAILQAALAAQVGALRQVPPAFAAIKRGGVPDYQRARAGEEVVRTPRAVAVHAIALLTHMTRAVRLNGADGPETALLPTLDLLIGCGKGTYIRSIARDLGDALGCGGHLAGLRRLASGAFTTRDCRQLNDLERCCREEGSQAIARALQPPDLALSAWPAAALGPEQALRARRGMLLRELPEGPPRLRIYDDQGGLLALAYWSGVAAQGPAAGYHPKTVFAGT